MNVEAVQEFQLQVSLDAEYDKYNRAYFGGELPPIKLSWDRSKTHGGVAMAVLNRQTREIRPTEIRISSFMKLDRARFDGIFLHEMIHIYQFMRQVNDSHGPAFKEMLGKISAKSGVAIPMTEEAVDLQVSDDVKVRPMVQILIEKGGGNLLILLPESAKGSFDELMAFLRGLAQRNSDFWGGIYETKNRELLKYPIFRKLPRDGDYKANRISADEFRKYKGDGKLLGEVTLRDELEFMESVKRDLSVLVGSVAESIEREFGVEFKTESSSKSWMAWASATVLGGLGKIQIEARSDASGARKLGTVYVSAFLGEKSVFNFSVEGRYPATSQIEPALFRALRELPPSVQESFFGQSVRKVAKIEGVEMNGELSARVAGRDAVERYRALRKGIDAKLRDLEERLKKHDKEFREEPDNWGYVGDLGHVDELLGEINSFLG
jgi:hypothetical protein